MTDQKKRVGLLGGTFDPIHIGHLNLALEAQEKFGLDEILFCPAYLSPFKQTETGIASAEDRLQMTSLAIEGIPGFKLLDYEVKKASISYTIDTVRFLKKSFPHYQYFLILGEDHLKTFMTWKEAAELMKLAPLKVASRLGVCSTADMPKEYHHTLHEGCFRIRNLEISSTDLRERLAQGLYSKHLIPPKVVDYIRQHRLYLPH